MIIGIGNIISLVGIIFKVCMLEEKDMVEEDDKTAEEQEVSPLERRKSGEISMSTLPSAFSRVTRANSDDTLELDDDFIRCNDEAPKVINFI